MRHRIVFIDHAPIIGGAQLALADHIAHLDRRVFEPYVLCGVSDCGMAQRFIEAGAEVVVTDLPRLNGMTTRRAIGTLQAVTNLHRQIRALEPALIVANTSRAAYLASFTRPRAPLVWWVRDFDFGKRIFHLLSRRADHIVCVSRAIAEFYGVSGSAKASVVPVATSLDERLRGISPEMVAAEREKWGFSPNHIVVGFMGRLVEGKGAADVVTAVANLTNDFPELRLLIVGSGKGQDGNVELELNRQVTEGRLADRVRFAGFQRDQALYHRVFDIFVLSSRYREAMPTSVMEAMLAGKPVIATETGGTPEVVTDRLTGLVVPPNRADAIEAALRELLSDRALADHLAAAGRAYAESSHRESAVTPRLESLYLSLARSSA